MFQPSLEILTESRWMMSFGLCVRCTVANMGCRLKVSAGDQNVVSQGYGAKLDVLRKQL